MNKQLTASEIAQFAVPLIDKPAEPVKPAMTRQEKLLKLAHIARWGGEPGGIVQAVREALVGKARKFALYHGLEFMSPMQLENLSLGGSIFALAAQDPTLQAAGFKGESMGEVQRFFELSQADLHEFSCNCGGSISNHDMANRIVAIANR